MDQPLPGSHPNGQVVDFELAEKVESAVRKRLQTRANHLQVEPSDGGIILRGYVRTYYEKQIAQNEALHVVGAGRVRDEVVVV